MRRYPIEILEVAYHNLQDIRDYIALDDPRMADIVIRVIASKIESQLGYFPLSGRHIVGTKRMLVETKFRYVVIYDFDGELVTITRIKKYQN